MEWINSYKKRDVLAVLPAFNVAAIANWICRRRVKGLTQAMPELRVQFLRHSQDLSLLVS